MRVLICPQSNPGYLYPALAVGIELRRRGHEAFVLAWSDAREAVAEAGLPFLLAEDYGDARAFDVKRWMLEGASQYRAILAAAREAGPDVLVTSVLCQGAILAAETLDLPVAVVGLTVHLGAYRRRCGEPDYPVTRAWRVRSLAGFHAQAREAAGLSPVSDVAASEALLGTLTLLRGDPELEYPGSELPEQVRHVGPCLWEPRADPEELGELTARLDRVGKPVVYVHLARVFDGPDPWPRLNAVFRDGPFQAVVELGRTSAPRPDPGADLVVVRKPWMGPLLDRASLVLTSATSAPVLNALVRGLPLGVSPVGSEQQVLAEACVRAGVAMRMPETSGADPAAELSTVCDDRGLRARAAVLSARLTAAGGTSRAGDAVEALAGQRPVAAKVTGTDPARTAGQLVEVDFE